MAKNSITDFDNTAANNTDIQSVNIDENCPASGINNAIRELMADLADVNDGTVALTSPKFDSIKDGNIKPPDASGTDVAGTATTIKGGAGTGTGAGGSIIFQTADGGSTGSSVNAHATAMTITDDGNINFTGSIKDSAGTNTALTIDSSGRVLMPNIPNFLAEGSASYVSYSSGDTLAYNSVTYGIQRNVGGHYSTSTYQFTAPVAGLYFFHASAYANAVVSSGLQLVHKNSGGTIQDKAIHYDTDTRSKQVTATFQMASGDTMEVQTEDAAYYYLNAYGRFLGYLIG